MEPKYIKSISVTDPDTRAEVEVEIWKLPNGGIVGIDASFLDKVDDTICDPFNEGEKITLPQEEVDRPTCEPLPDHISIEKGSNTQYWHWTYTDKDGTEYCGHITDDDRGGITVEWDEVSPENWEDIEEELREWIPA